MSYFFYIYNEEKRLITLCTPLIIISRDFY